VEHKRGAQLLKPIGGQTTDCRCGTKRKGLFLYYCRLVGVSRSNEWQSKTTTHVRNSVMLNAHSNGHMHRVVNK